MKSIVSTANAPGAIGPYSQAVSGTGTLVFVSGQLPVNPETGTMPEGISAQAEQSLKNVENILKAAGSGMDSVVKTTVFLSNMNNFAEMNAVYSRFFAQGSCPARSAVQVARLPKDALLEIEAIALA